MLIGERSEVFFLSSSFYTRKNYILESFRRFSALFVARLPYAQILRSGVSASDRSFGSVRVCSYAFAVSSFWTAKIGRTAPLRPGGRTSSSNQSARNDFFRMHRYNFLHHLLFKRLDQTQKIRVIFNASRASSNNTSLNDYLIGPKLQADLILLILKWRLHKYVILYNNIV